MCWLHIAVIVLVPYECNPMSVPLRHVAPKPNFWSTVCSTKARKIRRGPFFQENSTLFLTGDEVQRTSSLFSPNRNAMYVINFCWWYASNCDWFSFQVTCKKKKHFHSVNECISNKASSLILHIVCPTDYFSLGYSLKWPTEEKDGACIQL